MELSTRREASDIPTFCNKVRRARAIYTSVLLSLIDFNFLYIISKDTAYLHLILDKVDLFLYELKANGLLNLYSQLGILVCF